MQKNIIKVSLADRWWRPASELVQSYELGILQNRCDAKLVLASVSSKPQPSRLVLIHLKLIILTFNIRINSCLIMNNSQSERLIGLKC